MNAPASHEIRVITPVFVEFAIEQADKGRHHIADDVLRIPTTSSLAVKYLANNLCWAHGDGSQALRFADVGTAYGGIATAAASNTTANVVAIDHFLATGERGPFSPDLAIDNLRAPGRAIELAREDFEAFAVPGRGPFDVFNLDAGNTRAEIGRYMHACQAIGAAHYVVIISDARLGQVAAAIEDIRAGGGVEYEKLMKPRTPANHWWNGDVWIGVIDRDARAACLSFPTDTITRQANETSTRRMAVVACYWDMDDRRQPAVNCRNFLESMQRQGMPVFLGELTFNGQPQKFAARWGEGHTIHYDGGDSHKLFQKERLWMDVCRKLPPIYDTVAFVDADCELADSWIAETMQAIDSGARFVMPYRFGRLRESFAAYHQRTGLYDDGHMGHPGGTYAFDREFIETYGLYEAQICGSGDTAFIAGMMGNHARIRELYPPKLADDIIKWGDKIHAAVGGKIQATGDWAWYMWHGTSAGRKYVDRLQMLHVHDFDPQKDIEVDGQGLLRFHDEACGLRQEIREYFAGRKEDG